MFISSRFYMHVVIVLVYVNLTEENTTEVKYIHLCVTPMTIANKRNVSEGLSENCSYCLLTQVTPVTAN